MPRVKLSGLNIRQNSAGTWYVSWRASGKLLGQAKSRKALDALMATPAFLDAYSLATQAKSKRTYPTGTFGALVDWYKTKPAYERLAERSKADYLEAEKFLEPAAAYATDALTRADVVEMRDRAARTKYPKFSNTVVAFMSAVFREAVEAEKMAENPALGVRRLYKPSEGANRPWKLHEWEGVVGIAPWHLLVPLSVFRWAGLRGEDVAGLPRDAYRPDGEMGKVLAFHTLKHGRFIEIGVLPQLEAVLDRACADLLPGAPICRNSLGLPYPTVNAMRKAWQDFKAGDAFRGALPHSADLTLHGLRVTYASMVKEAGFDDRAIADAIGDKSESMGRHYSRGARARSTAVRIFRKLGNTA